MIRLQPLPGAREVPLGGRDGARREGRGHAPLPRLRALHGRRLQDDHHRRRVSDLLYTTCSLHPVRAKYPWVGCLTDDEKDGEGGDSRTPHARSLFMAADNTMITIGGGYVQSMVLCGPLRFRIIEY